jgi:hypothetical protein
MADHFRYLYLGMSVQDISRPDRRAREMVTMGVKHDNIRGFQMVSGIQSFYLRFYFIFEPGHQGPVPT